MATTARPADTLWLGGHTRSAHQLTLEFGVDDLRFSASYWYEDVDLVDLERRHGTALLERLYFHVAAFTANTLVSLQPRYFDPGPYGRWCSPEFWALWRRVVSGVWGQWRYEHDLPDYRGPVPLVRPQAGRSPEPRVRVPARNPRALAFFGGGKDSVVALRLLQDAGVPCDTLAYSSSTYGGAGAQHALADGVLDALGTPDDSRRRLWSYDDLADSPVTTLGPRADTRSLTTAETPASVFAALPLALEHGYSLLALGHERSADLPNLVWGRTGEAVNHQWGKSLECQRLLARYVHRHLVEGCRYFSPLKPVHDPLIFSMLAAEPAAAPLTHSCNVAKPWCGRCAKCAYVWLGYHAYLPPELARRTFGGLGNLLDVPDNERWFRQLLGLATHTPFECVGGVDESRLAFELCRRRGLRGRAMGIFEREVAPVDALALADRYLEVETGAAGLPSVVASAVTRRLEAASAAASHRVAKVLARRPAAPRPDLTAPCLRRTTAEPLTA